ncbi:ABC transporter substrate-binding protein, partial [Thiohalocapsa marina]
KLLLLLLLLIPGWPAVLADTAASGSPSNSPPPLQLALQWTPQSQFAGFYVAQARGLYAKAGLDVRLLHADSERSSLQLLQSGDADLATAFLADALIAAADTPDTNGLAQVAQLVQYSNLMLVAWKGLGIEQAEDLDGRLVSHWQGAFSASFAAFFDAQGVEPKVIPQHGSINLFLDQGVAACAAMEYNELHHIWQAGVDYDKLTRFRMRDFGFGFPEDGLYARADWIARHPEQALALRQATLAGWAHARTHPEEAIDLVLAQARDAGIPANRPHERWMLTHMLKAIFPPRASAQQAGALDPDAFDDSVRTLRAAGLIDQPPTFTRFAPLEPDPAAR